MELSYTRSVPAPPAEVWAALNDPLVLKKCLPGCESIDAVGEHAWQVVMAARVGPVSARFNGRMTMTDIDAPTAYTLRFDGQGGAAGFARGDARVTLAADGERQTTLTYAAKAQVGGKLAQIGSRLVDGAAAKLTDDFFACFVEHLRGPQPADADRSPASGAAAGTVGSADARAVGTPGSAREPATPIAPGGGSPWIRYAAIAAIVIVLIVLYVRG